MQELAAVTSFIVGMYLKYIHRYVVDTIDECIIYLLYM